MLDARVEIASDFSVFHRIDDPMALPGSRYFEFAELLPSYQGAVRVALSRLTARQQEAEGPADVMSPETLAALSDHPGFPGIEFT